MGRVFHGPFFCDNSIMRTSTRRLRPQFLALLFLASLPGCSDKENPAGQNVAPDTEQSTTAAQPQARSGSATKDVPQPKTSDVTAISVPNRKYFSVLADAYRRIDPKADGWDTEAFSEKASKQLKLLKAIFKSGDFEKLDGLVASSVKSTPFLPSELEDLYSADDATIANAKSLPTETTFTNGEQFVEGAIKLRERLDNQIDHAELKVVSVTPQASEVETDVKVTFVAHSSNQQLQINANWLVSWSPDAKHITGLKVTKYQEVALPETPRLFSDVTASVLGGESAWEQQFLVGTDYWRCSITRNLGLDAGGNHGLAVGDVNGDQLDDLYVLQQGGIPNRLFIRQPDGLLKDQSAASGTDWLDYCTSSLIIDIDNDRDRDLVIATEFSLIVMKNDGTGKFKVSEKIKLPAQAFSTAAADYDQDGDLDIYVCGYNPLGRGERQTDMGEPIPFHDANNAGESTLLQNDGTGSFTNVTKAVGIDVNNRRFSFSAAWEDFDNDGDLDLYVANDFGRNNLYQNEDGKFTDVAPEMGVEDGAAGMSASWGDYNRDGRMDIYISNMFSSAGNRITYQRQFKPDTDPQVLAAVQHTARGNTLFENTPDGFIDTSVDAGVTFGRWAWGSRFCDLNNDGYEDLLVANGFITATNTQDL